MASIILSPFGYVSKNRTVNYLTIGTIEHFFILIMNSSISCLKTLAALLNLSNSWYFAIDINRLGSWIKSSYPHPSSAAYSGK
jgi:hypothetical protein